MVIESNDEALANGDGARSGWRDLCETVAAAGLPEPPIPSRLRQRVMRLDRWLWASRRIARGSLSDPVLARSEPTGRVRDCAAVAHVGHGVNSYLLSYQLAFGPLWIFVQVGWGGAYMDSSTQAELIRQRFSAVSELVSVIEPKRREWAGDRRLVVIDAAEKGWAVCEWRPVGAVTRTDFEKVQPDEVSPDVLREAASELVNWRRAVEDRAAE